MALNATQKVTVAEITQETHATIDSLSSSLNAEQETSIIADIATWNLIRNSHVKLTDKVDFDNERKRSAIRQRVRKALGLPLFSEEVQPTSGAVANRFVF